MIEKSKLKEGDIVWACAFNIDLDRQSHFGGKVVHSKQEPIKGIIHDRCFHVLKQDGTPRANGVSTYSRDFAETEDECIDIYNRKISEKIDKLCGAIKELRKELIWRGESNCLP